MRAQRILAFLGFLAVGLVLWGGVGCVGPVVDVDFDEGEDFSLYRTWSWLPHTTSNLDVPGGKPEELDALLAHTIAGHLEQGGLRRVRSREADLLVGYRFSVRQRAEIVNVPRAPYLLPSLHASNSWLIEGSERETQIHRDVELWIGLLEPDGRVVWQGAVRRRYEKGEAFRLRDVVSALLDRLPDSDPAVVGSAAPNAEGVEAGAPTTGSDP